MTIGCDMLSNLAFFLQVIAFFACGFIWQYKSNKKALLIIVLLGILLPYTASFQAFYYKSGLSVFDSFLIGAGFGFILLNLRVKGFYLTKMELIFFSILFLLISMFSLVSLLKVDLNYVYYVKDLKPLILLGFAYLFCNKCVDHQSKGKISATEESNLNVRLLSAGVLVKNTFLFILFSTLGMSFFYTGDVYIDLAETSVRYADYANLFLILLILKMLFTDSHHHGLETKPEHQLDVAAVVFASLSISLYSGSRTFLFVNLFLITLWLSRFRGFYIISILMLLIAVVTFNGVVGDIELGRFEDLLSLERLKVLLYNRFYPVLSMYDDGLSLSDFLFGYGLGTSFYIPWMEGIGQLSPNQVYIDNFILTLFAKYGILGVLLSLIVFGAIFFSIATSWLQFIAFFVVFFLLSLTTSFWYQINFSYLMISFMYLFAIKPVPYGDNDN